MATIKVCDVCGCPADTSDFFVLVRAMDAAGSMESDGALIDLCWKHRSMALDRAFQVLRCRSKLDAYESSRIVVDMVKKLQSECKK